MRFTVSCYEDGFDHDSARKCCEIRCTFQLQNIAVVVVNINCQGLDKLSCRSPKLLYQNLISEASVHCHDVDSARAKKDIRQVHTILMVFYA